MNDCCATGHPPVMFPGRGQLDDMDHCYAQSSLSPQDVLLLAALLLLSPDDDSTRGAQYSVAIDLSSNRSLVSGADFCGLYAILKATVVLPVRPDASTQCLRQHALKLCDCELHSSCMEVCA